MYILNYLFYKYYWFQVRVGNKDNAVFNTILMITLIISLYISAGFMAFVFFYNNQCENQNTPLLWDNNRRSYFLFVNVYFFIQAKIQEDYNG